MMRDVPEGKPRDYNEALRLSAEPVPPGQDPSCLRTLTYHFYS